jgi:hypothetical protein
VREIGKTNRGAAIDQWQLAAGRYALGTYWCSWFVSAGFKACAVPTAYFGMARSWADPAHIILNHGKPVAGAPAPQPYDLVCYEWGNTRVVHVGFNDLWGSTSMCQTIEGNTGGGKQSRDGDGVYKNWRLKSQVAYVVNVVDRPSYGRKHD